MKIKAINIPAAGSWARDCELISLSYGKGFRISYHRDEDNTYWEMQCEGVIELKVFAEEFSIERYLIKLPVEGAFFEILDSPWIVELEQKHSRILDNYKHYVLEFYDETIQIIAQKFIFEQLKEKPANSPY